jgi:hypothetical protein
VECEDVSAIGLSDEQTEEGVFTEQHVGNVGLARTPGELRSEWFEVTVTQYAGSASEPTGVRRGVGSYHHLGGRYVASQLTSAEARELAAFLLAAARRVDERDT